MKQATQALLGGVILGSGETHVRLEEIKERLANDDIKTGKGRLAGIILDLALELREDGARSIGEKWIREHFNL
jgi:hypothetical protein